MSTPRDILEFWFGPRDAEDFGEPRPAWFQKDAAFDAEVRRRFAEDHAAAVDGELEPWKDAPESCLAWVILVDQLSRNLYRDDPRAWSWDPLALDATERALERGFDRELHPIERQFLYMPLMHSEDAADQARSRALYEQLAEDGVDAVKWAVAHEEIIDRFGRFPHRNATLGRESTAEERAFLKEPGSSF